jgi:hypothetical protein
MSCRTPCRHGYVTLAVPGRRAMSTTRAAQLSVPATLTSSGSAETLRVSQHGGRCEGAGDGVGTAVGRNSACTSRSAHTRLADHDAGRRRAPSADRRRRWRRAPQGPDRSRLRRHRCGSIVTGHAVEGDEPQTDTVRHARDRRPGWRGLADSECCGEHFCRVSRILESACWLGKRGWNESGPAWGATAGDVWQLADACGRDRRKDDVDAVASAGCSAASE